MAGRVRVRGFDGKLVFITGGSSGIGLAAARLLAREGADVVIFARGKERLEEALREIEKAKRRAGQRAAWKQMDVTDHRQVMEVLEETVREFGPPDVLINCAGRAYPNYFENITYEQFDETMKVHAYGAWNTVSALYPHMKEKGGYIVNTSSVLGFMGIFGYTDYAASKFAVVGFSEALRSEARRHGIGVSVLCPPDTDTPGFAVENLTKPPETRAISEGGGLLQPGEVAEALLRGMKKGVFLIGPGSAGMLYRVKRFFPWLVDFFSERAIRKAAKGKSG
ncbi:MAG: SDR family oxidoreductase [Actinobacteria bacterium]|nr:SDR family oxidoreductase [Actinomycetota bacterium]